MTLRWQHDLAVADGVDCSYICDVAVQIFRNRERAIRTALVESA